jgi:hypothetical protein
VLLDRVSIETLPQLAALNARLSASCCTDVRSPPAGHMIHVLKIALPPADGHDSTVREALPAVVCHTARLVRYSLAGRTSTPLELRLLADVAGASLVLLDVELAPGGPPVFPLLRALVRLETLFLAIAPGAWTHPPTHALRMPRVTDLAWTCTEGDDGAMLAFLAACVLGPALSVQLDLPHLRAARAPLLRPFFARNAVADLTLALPAAAQNALAPQLVRVRALEFFKFVPGPALLAPGVLPRTLTLPLREGPRAQARFWEFLDALRGMPARPPAERTVLEIYVPKQEAEFDWRAEDRDQPLPFIQRLAPVARELLALGVVVTDRQRRDVTCLDEQGSTMVASGPRSDERMSVRQSA